MAGWEGQLTFQYFGKVVGAPITDCAAGAIVPTETEKVGTEALYPILDQSRAGFRHSNG